MSRQPENYSVLSLSEYDRMTSATRNKTHKVFPGPDAFVDKTKTKEGRRRVNPFPVRRGTDRRPNRVKMNPPAELAKIPSAPADRGQVDYVLMRDTLHYSDVVQGGLRDCWLMASLASLVNVRPDLLPRIVRKVPNRDPSLPDQYQVTLYHEGGQRVVTTITDRFPCADKRGQVGDLLFASSRARQMYVLLIEKGMAYLDDNYEAIDFGCTVKGMNALTGCPSRSNSFGIPSDKDAANKKKMDNWNRIREYLNEGFLVTVNSRTFCHCSMRNDDKTVKTDPGMETEREDLMVESVKMKDNLPIKKKYKKRRKKKSRKKFESKKKNKNWKRQEKRMREKEAEKEEEDRLKEEQKKKKEQNVCDHMRQLLQVGLSDNHMYSVIKIDTIDSKPIIRLYDPHGDASSWKGDFHDCHELWNGRQMDFEANQQNSGSFWMSIDDFFEYFRGVNYCMLRDDWLSVDPASPATTSKVHRFVGPLPDDGLDQFHRMTTFFVSIDQPSELFISLHQQYDRYTPKQVMAIGVFKFNKSSNFPTTNDHMTMNFEDFSGYFVHKSSTADCDLELEPGIYLVVPYVLGHWPYLGSSHIPQYSMVFHCDEDFDVKHYQTEMKIIPLSLFELLRHYHPVRVENGRDAPDVLRISWLNVDWDGGILAVENLSHTKSVKVSLKDNIKLSNMISTRGGPGGIVDVIPPRHWQLLHIFSPAFPLITPASDLKEENILKDCLDFQFLPADSNPESHEPQLDHLAVIHSSYPIRLPQ